MRLSVIAACAVALVSLPLVISGCGGGGGAANSSPTVTITGGPSGDTADTNPTFTWTGADSDGQVTWYAYRVDNGAWSSVRSDVTSTTIGPLPAGQHTFEVRSQDDDSAFSQIASRSFTVMELNSPPTVSIASGPSDETTNTNPTFSWTGGDSDGQVVEYWYRVDAASWTVVGPGVTQATVGPLALGDHVFKVKSKDDDGDYSEVASRSFTVIPNTGDVPIIVD